MKRFGLFILLGLLFASFSPKEQKLILKIRNLHPSAGVVYVDVCDKEDDFPGKSMKMLFKAIPTKGAKEINIEISSLMAGKKYAFSLYQDLNLDKKLNTNSFGMPTEPYGFSNNIKAKYSAPTFEKCVFEFSGNNFVTVDLVH